MGATWSSTTNSSTTSPQQSPTSTFSPNSPTTPTLSTPSNTLHGRTTNSQHTTATPLWSSCSSHSLSILPTTISQSTITLSSYIKFTRSIKIDQWTHYDPIELMTLRHPQIRRKSWRRPPTPHSHFSSLVYIQLSLGWLDPVETYSNNAHKICSKMLHWTAHLFLLWFPFTGDGLYNSLPTSKMI